MKKLGFSIVEILVALGILGVLLPVGVGLGIQSLNMSRKSSEKTEGLYFAQDGLEAARSMAAASWGSMAAGNYGLNSAAGAWQFVPTGDTRGKFNRVISVSPLYRDGSQNLVESPGTLDSDAVKVSSTVNWVFGGAISNNVSVSTYLTNFRKSIWGAGDAFMAYSGAVTQPYWRFYDDATTAIGPQTTTLNGVSPRSFAMATSPKKSEAIVAYVSNTGGLNVLCFDGATWTAEWTATLGGDATRRRFDVAYETNSGDVVVVYSRNVATTNELGYRVKLGSTNCGAANWSAESLINPVRTSGIVHWVKLEPDRRASNNLIALAWSDAAEDLSSMIWSGSAWGNEPTNVSETALERATAATDVDVFDLDYESLSGDMMLVWGVLSGANGTNGVRYRVCTGGTATCTWGAVSTPPTFSDDATNLDLSANLNTDQMVFASIGGAGNDLQIGYWSGSAWTDTANVDTSCAATPAGNHRVTTSWISIPGVGDRSVVVYNDQGSGALNWYVGNAGVFTLQADVVLNPVMANNQTWMMMSRPRFLTKDRTLLTVVDNNNQVHVKRLLGTQASGLTWSNVNIPTGLPDTLTQRITFPIVTEYWEYKPI